MSYTNELIDRLKKQHNLESDYSVARLLGLRPNRISNYRTGTSHADDKTAVILADALKLDRLETIARINMDRATAKEDKAFWRKLASAAGAVLLLVGMARPADAMTHVGVTDQPHDLYIMRNYKDRQRDSSVRLA